MEANTSALHYAAGSGDANELIGFLQPGTVEQYDLNAPDGYGRTPLVYSVLSDAIDCCQLLLQAGAVVDATDTDGRTAVHWAAFQGSSKMLKMFLEQAGNVLAQDSEGRTPLHLSTGAESSKCIKQIIKRLPAGDGSIDTLDNDQMTAAHWCAFHGHHKHLDLLIAAGANLAIPDGEGKLPIHWTSANANTKTLAKIYAVVPDTLNVKDNEGRTLLHLAVADGSMPIVQALLDIGQGDISLPDAMFRTPLHWAAVLGNAELATLLLQYGANPIAPDDNGASALHYTTQNESNDCMRALLQVEGVTDFPDVDGRTAVMWAAGAVGADAEAITMMMERGFDVLAVDNTGGTALHAAAYAGNNDICSVLLSYGAGIDVLDSMQHTPLVRACEMGHTAVVSTLLAGGTAATVEDVDGRTPLHWAALGGFDYICRSLVENGANVDAVDTQGRTPLQCAAYGGFIDVMTVLCENKADVNTCDEEGISALHWASSTGQLEAVKLLTKHGAIPNQMEADGDQLTPLDYANIGDGEGNVHTAIVDFLSTQGALTADTIKELSASKLQNAWRTYKGRKGKARGMMGISGKGKSRRASYAVAKNRKIVGDAKSMAAKESAADRKAKTDMVATSAVEREAMKRKKRIREREEREKAQKEERDAREKEDAVRRQQASSILLRSAKLHTTTLKERSRMEVFREKQRAATTIQVFWKQWKYKGFVPATNRKRAKTTRKGATSTAGAVTLPSQALLETKIDNETAVTINALDEGMKGLKLKQRKLAIVDTFKQTDEWREAVAALTIQLFWRQYRRKKLVAAAARRKKAYLDEWRAKQNLREEFSDKANQQRKKFTAVYAKQVTAHPYHAPGPVPMYRPSYITHTPSAAVTSFNFAVGSYVSKHNTTRRGSLDITRRSPSRRNRGGRTSTSPKKKPVFAF